MGTPMKKRYVVANWKSHTTVAEAEKWLAAFLGAYRPDPGLQVIIAPSLVCLAPLQRMLREQGAPQVALAAQDLSPFPVGAYTGAVAAAMVRDLVDYALVGHAERRRYFHETHQEVANKATEAVAVGITPILCLDQPYGAAQIAALAEADADRVIIGYGPVEAIGLTIPQPLSQVAKAVQELRAHLP
ncbi:MAG: triose-phosphate isomerase, partial [Desulfobulbaceae bacterium]|nr:triose-phosphate isomerase [Desulfobulbaceae bacterium]